MRRADHLLPAQGGDASDVSARPIADRHAPHRGRTAQRRAALAFAILFAFPASAVAQGPSTNEAGLKVVGRTFVAIQVRDEVAAADWYIGVFGLEEVNRLEAADGPYSIRILSGGGISVELIRNHATSARTTEPPLGLFKAGFYVDDIEATLAWLRSRGVDKSVAGVRAVRGRLWRVTRASRIAEPGRSVRYGCHAVLSELNPPGP